MTADQLPGLVAQCCGVGFVGASLILAYRAGTRRTAEDGGVLKQTVTGHESRLCAVEHVVDGIGADRAVLTQLKGEVGSLQGEVREMTKVMTSVQIALAVLPEQLVSLKESSKSQHEATTHSLRNLRASIEGLGRRAGVVTSADS